MVGVRRPQVAATQGSHNEVAVEVETKTIYYITCDGCNARAPADSDNRARAIFDTIKAGSARQILVTVSDLRIPQSHSEFETVFGDGGVAFLIGDSDVAVSLEDMYTVSDEILDEWVAGDETFPRGWESRFVYEKGYLRVFPQAVAQLLNKTGLSVGDFAKAAFYGFNARRHTDMAKKLAFSVGFKLQAFHSRNGVNRRANLMGRETLLFFQKE